MSRKSQSGASNRKSKVHKVNIPNTSAQIGEFSGPGIAWGHNKQSPLVLHSEDIAPPFGGEHPTLKQSRLQPSLRAVAAELIDRLANGPFKAPWIRQAVVFPYVRHVLSTDTCPYWLASDADETAAAQHLELARQSWQLGLQPLVRVLDSVRNPRSDLTAVRIRFVPRCEPGTCGIHIDPRDKEFPHDCVGLTVASEVPDGPGVPPEYRRLFPERDLLNSTSDLDVLRTVFGSFEEGAPLVVHESMCAMEVFCKRLKLTSNMILYRSLSASLLEAHRWHEHMQYNQAIVLLKRDLDPFGFGIGCTVYYQGSESSDSRGDSGPAASAELLAEADKRVQTLLAECRSCVLDFVNAASDVLRADSINSSNLKRETEDAIRSLRDIRSRRKECRSSKLTRQIAAFYLTRLEERFGCSGNHMKRLGEDEFAARLSGFLRYCKAFCDEKLEGRDLQFGLLLGDPFLVRYWPGGLPVPSEVVKQESELHGRGVHARGRGRLGIGHPERVAEHVHWIENPLDQCIVFHYELEYEDSNPPPVYAIDVGDFEEAVSTWDQGRVWSSQVCRKYAFLTQQYLWAISAVVGPGSLIRVFCLGELVAYRNGKGWRCRSTDFDELVARARGDATAMEAKDTVQRLSALLPLAMQMSPMLCPGSHGGFIVSVPDGGMERTGHGFDAEDFPRGIVLTPLHRGEILRLQAIDVGANRRLWLSGKQLMEQCNQTGTWIINPNVGRLVLRAAMIDGAIVLEGNECRVKGFGQQIIVPPSNNDGRATGTKRATAMNFVKFCGEGSLAITVSSDGPIRYFCQVGSRTEVGELFQEAESGPSDP